jgi:hypothetical protein
MVVPQSWVLYSRLHLIVHNQRLLRWLRGVLIFNSVVFSVPTIVVGILAVSLDALDDDEGKRLTMSSKRRM